MGDPLRRVFPADSVHSWRDALFQQGEPPPIGEACNPVVLWFEHDLYDQAQLVEILDTLHGRPGVWLIQVSDYLGHMSEEELRASWPQRTPVGQQQYVEAREAWIAFRSPEPRALCRVNPSTLPYVRPAWLRRAQDYPWLEDGCSLTERGILLTVRAGYTGAGRLFGQWSQRENPRWMGDTAFFDVVHDLKSGPEPLLDALNRITARGLAVLEGRDDRRRGETTPWRWDRASSSIVPYPAK